MRLRRLLIVGCALLAAALPLAGCGENGGGGTKIGLLLPESEAPRYESHDRPGFEKAVEKRCDDCEVLYSNAGGDASEQLSQAESALSEGVKVLVVDPVDSKSATAIAKKAKAQGVPVVSYDRLIKNAPIDAYVFFDSEAVGELQGLTLAVELDLSGDNPRGPIIMINGDQADPNAALLKQGAYEAFKENGVDVAIEYDTPGGTAENAQREVRKAITALGENGFGGIYAADDITAGGAIAALEEAGIDPSEKPVTGQDATLAGLQRILADQQFMTVYKEFESEARISAEIAISLAEGNGVPKGQVTQTVNNGAVDVPSVLLEPISVTKEFINEPVEDGFVSVEELCTGPYESACSEAGI